LGCADINQELAMTRTLFASVLLTTLVACAADGSDTGDDVPVEPTPGHIALTGKHLEQGQSGESALGGAVITAYRTSDGSQVASATTDSSGTFTLDISETPCDCYVHASKAGYADTYLYPASPWSQSATIDTAQLTSTTFTLLNTFAGGTTTKGLIIATVVSGSGAPVTGAKISSSPASGSYKYSDGSGQPTGSAGTTADGIAFFMSAPVGDISISASKSGMTFKTHSLNAHAGALTMTFISE
jgi:hypothetical protein